jgi:hypothetical protein
MKEIITRMVIDDGGNVIDVTTETNVLFDTEHCVIRVIFDDKCCPWERDRERNLIYLKMQEEYFKTVSEYKGYATLNDFYRAIGHEEDLPDGFAMGWDCTRGDRVDLGLDKALYDEDCCSIIMEFNVRKNIWRR